MEFGIFMFFVGGIFLFFLLISCCCRPSPRNNNSRCREPRYGERLAHYCSRHTCHGTHCRRNCRSCPVNSTGESIPIHVISSSGHWCEGHSANSNISHLCSHDLVYIHCSSSPPGYNARDSICGAGGSGIPSSD